ncbi:MAG: flagellar biosynthesis anti-sigma factor FlgM [Sulfuricellaceae bacterium]|nr:flagellar biosynthesis anti-sigma factor FlgM [Sulfuricellaceae bacterium]
MKIDGNITKPLATPAGEKTVRSQTPATSSGKESASADEVNLSSTGQLQAMRSSMSESPVDTAKVEAIKQAIAEGRFKVNPEAIAEGLLNDVRDLLKNQKN